MITFYELGSLGRLGNQLFQYAALRGLGLKMGYETKIPDPSKRRWHGQECLLGNFNIQSPYLDDNEEDLLQINNMYSEPNSMAFDDSFFNIPDNTNLTGFFQSIYYFKDQQEEIKKELTPKDCHLKKATEEFLKLKEKFPEHEIVSLHVRRGDNTDNVDPNQYSLSEYYSPSGLYRQYLGRAFESFEGRKVKYLVFTGGKRGSEDNVSDIEWAKDNFRGDEFIFSEGKNPLEDFCLIMKCNHHIVSPSSTFGWWAAYLVTRKEKIIIAPLKYQPELVDINYRPGFYPEEWKLL